MISPSARHSSRRKPDGRPTGRRPDGGKHKERKPDTKKPEKKPNEEDQKKKKGGYFNRKACLILLILLIAVGAIVAVIILTSIESHCDIVLRNESASVLEIQICARLACPFDVTLCDLQCPMGYTIDEEGCPNSCICATETDVFEGDIAINKETLPSMLENYGILERAPDADIEEGFVSDFGNTINTDIYQIWDKNLVDGRYKIPYNIDYESFIGREKSFLDSKIGEALLVLSSQTCLDFIKEPTKKEHFIFLSTRSNGCSSFVGRAVDAERGLVEQEIRLGYKLCLNTGTIIHETMHALGFLHEQARPDRDVFVEVHDENIIKGFEGNFQKFPPEELNDFPIKYDISSIMHYGGFFFASDPWKPTITRRDNDEPVVENRIEPTKLDIAEVNLLYRCKELEEYAKGAGTSEEDKTTGDTSETGEGGTSETGEGGTSENGEGGTSETGEGGTSETGEGGTSENGEGGTSENGEGGTSENGEGGTSKTTVGITSETPQKTKTEDAIEAKGTWSKWGEWSGCEECSRVGTATRTRSCVGGNLENCRKLFGEDSITVQTQFCSNFPCKTTAVPKATWNLWTAWGACSATCGSSGQKTRTRTCNGNNCVGPTEESFSCDGIPDCPARKTSDTGKPTGAGTGGGSEGQRPAGSSGGVAGGDGDQKESGSIDAALRAGQDKKKSGVSGAGGETFVPTPCDHSSTFQYGGIGWSEWDSWTGCGNCAKTGMGRRRRACADVTLERPYDQYAAASTCQEPGDTGGIMMKPCSEVPCVSEWCAWSKAKIITQCSATCGSGTLKKKRTCSSDYGPCVGNGTADLSCKVKDCPDAPIKWLDWGIWIGCEGCGEEGFAVRTRHCSGGEPLKCASDEELEETNDPHLEYKQCSDIEECLQVFEWGNWFPWLSCSKTCEGGLRLRYRKCSGERVDNCYGQHVAAQHCATEKCNEESTWVHETDLFPCSATCGDRGYTVIKRTCPGDRCNGKEYFIDKCNQIPCGEQHVEVYAQSEDSGATMFSPTPLTTSISLCDRFSRSGWVFGDFNGDERTDVLCGDESGQFKVGLSEESGEISAVHWQGRISGCGGGKGISADFNGDGSDDLLCQNIYDRLLSISLSSRGVFSSAALYRGSFCTHHRDTVHVLDYDGDGKADVLCNSDSRGIFEIMLSISF